MPCIRTIICRTHVKSHAILSDGLSTFYTGFNRQRRTWAFYRNIIECHQNWLHASRRDTIWRNVWLHGHTNSFSLFLFYSKWWLTLFKLTPTLSHFLISRRYVGHMNRAVRYAFALCRIALALLSKRDAMSNVFFFQIHSRFQIHFQMKNVVVDCCLKSFKIYFNYYFFFNSIN